MSKDTSLEIFLTSIPGFEETLKAELIEKGFKKPKTTHGGVTVKGDWGEVWRANLQVRGATRVLVRLGQFTAAHLSQLDKRARSFPWEDILRPHSTVRVEATCKKSKIYHQGAAKERIENGLRNLSHTIDDDADICIKARIIDNQCTLSIDTSGDALHIRGHKAALNKAPLRETMAALILRECGFKGKEPVVDPMCGSGTFVLEAAEIAMRLNAGRSRTFTFEKLETFDADLWLDLKEAEKPFTPDFKFHGYDRDQGAIDRSIENAQRGGIEQQCEFSQQPISKLTAPAGEPGLVVINPPYGIRIGDVKKLTNLYQNLGHRLQTEFKGWRVGLLTNAPQLAKATGLKFDGKPMVFSHGGIKVGLYKTEAL